MHWSGINVYSGMQNALLGLGSCYSCCEEMFWILHCQARSAASLHQTSCCGCAQLGGTSLENKFLRTVRMPRVADEDFVTGCT
jgi:hypothetical protein